ncbi:MAG: arsenate reductase (glutaredoxin) [Bacteroidales bacterium]|nr:arsenate reductase (glutaredoxin) [Bacteroidales bacterium]MBK9357057.1 arsenate reductase (glutaredoxin) [Bacteroidales bacterium]
MMVVYHNPKCRKSRAGLEYVRRHDPSATVVEYIREGISKEEVKKLILMLGIHPIELVRTQEDYYRENLKDIHPSDEEWYQILAENPRLIRRPVVVSNGKAVIADPPEKAGIFFNNQ